MKLHLITCPFQAINALGWVVSISLLLAANLAMYPISQIENTPSIMDDALYNVFSRLIWAIGLSYIIFACVHGYGGPGNWFLSLKIWQPIARLSYSMYLVQYVVLIIYNGSMRDAPFFSDALVVSNYFGIYHIIIRTGSIYAIFFILQIQKFFAYYTLTFLVAIPATLAFELPVIALDKILRSKLKPKKSETAA